MYVVAPALPPPYKWLQIPLNGLHTDRWSRYFTTWPGRYGSSSNSIMIPVEIKEAFFKSPGVRGPTQWTFAVLATATVVTSAMALYYYASTYGYDTTSLNLRYYASLLKPQDFDWTSALTSSMFEMGDFDEEDHDDDEHIDPDLLDGYGMSTPKPCGNVQLISSDPSSDLCHRPFQLDLVKGRTSRTPSLLAPSLPGSRASILKSSCADLGAETVTPQLPERKQPMFEPFDLARDKRGQALHDYSITGSGDLSDSSLKSESMPFATGSTTEELSDDAKGRALETRRRKVFFVEPDWEPFIECHGRARQRMVLAVLAKSYADMSSRDSAPSTPSEAKALEFFKHTLPEVGPVEMGDGSEFWFERFTRSTAASSKRLNLKKRKDEIASTFDSDMFDELLPSSRPSTPTIPSPRSESKEHVAQLHLH